MRLPPPAAARRSEPDPSSADRGDRNRRGAVPGSWLHLAGRFFEVLAARPLSPEEREEAAGLLNPGEEPLFFAQAVADQRHGLVASRRVAQAEPHRRELLRAALLHDIGKRHARLGVWGRVVASVLAKLGLPLPGRLGTYHRHGPLAAAELAELGAEALVVEFAAAHHESRPLAIAAPDWDLLKRADSDGR